MCSCGCLRLEPGGGALRVIGRAMLEEGRVLLGCRSELLQLRVHALLDFASGVEAAQEHRRISPSVP